MNTPIGLFGLSSRAREVWMRRAIMSRPCCWPMTRWPSVSPSFSTASISFFTIRPTGMPVQSATTLATACASTDGQDQRRLALQRGELGLQLVQLRQQLSRSLASAGSAPCRRRVALPPSAAAGRRPACRRRAAARAARGPGRRSPSPRCQRCLERRRAARARARSFSSTSVPARCRSSTPTAASRSMMPRLDLERLDAAPAVLDLGRRRVLADRDAGAGGVEQAHRLVGQLARRDVAVRQLHRRLDRLVEELHAVVLLEHAGDAAQHQHRLRLVGLGDLHHLEAARQRRVLLDVLLVLGPGGGGDGAQLAARQRGLEQVGGVAGAGRAAGADQRVRLVDEQDDRLRATPAPRRSPGAGASRTRPSCWRRPAAGRGRASSSDTSCSCGGTSPRAIRSAKPSTTAVLPTPASPVRIGLFWRRRIRMSTIWRISSSRPIDRIDLALRAPARSGRRRTS